MRPIIILPCLNEEENIKRLVGEILGLNLGVFILIVTDKSTDKTEEIADTLAKKHPEVKVIHRRERKGLGAAYITGLKYALDLGVNKVITMDADFSHDPKDIPRFLKESEKYDMVIGSRYVAGGRLVRWELLRKLLSWGGINMAKLLLGLKTKDCTTGFRCYGKNFLESLKLDEIASHGHAFLIEVIFKAQNQGFSIFEIPITFKGREEGESKIDFKEICRFARSVLRIKFRL